MRLPEEGDPRDGEWTRSSLERQNALSLRNSKFTLDWKNL